MASFKSTIKLNTIRPNKMKVSKNEILLIYNSSYLHDRETLAYAKSLKNHELKEFDLQNNSLNETQLNQITKRMDVKPNELINTKSTKYLRYYFDTDLTQKSTLKVLKRNPGMIKTPIAVYNDHAEFIKTPYEFIRKDMAM